LSTARPNVPPFVEMGRGTYLSPDTRFMAWAPGEKVVIGHYCSIAGQVLIWTGGNHRPDNVSTYPFDNLLLGRPNPTRTYQTTRPTTLGSDVWVGQRAMIGGGAQVGHGAVIGAAAVVFSDVPPYAIVTGNPANVRRYRFDAATTERLLRIAWWNWPEDVVRDRIEWFYRPVAEFVAEFDPEGRGG
jgi:acetyltransferase-like isoleucine patch superfamily enzyme